ncbi:MAG: hypothetical protein ACRCX2_32060 [Paraclostridium sp.]
MLMMFGQSMKYLPFDRILPYNDDDLLVVVEKDIAFRLSNIVTDTGSKFSIRYTIENNDVFSCERFDQRVIDFLSILDTRLERYFETEKSGYLFFDEEEQSVLHKMFSTRNLNCHVEIYMNTGATFKQVVLEELNPKITNRIIKHMSALRIRGILDCREYYDYKFNQYKKVKETMKKFNMKKRGAMDVYMKRYPKLAHITSKSVFKKYFRQLLAKYHPDANFDSNANDIFVVINNDKEAIEKTGWYKKLTR